MQMPAKPTLPMGCAQAGPCPQQLLMTQLPKLLQLLLVLAAHLKLAGPPFKTSSPPLITA